MSDFVKIAVPRKIRVFRSRTVTWGISDFHGLGFCVDLELGV